ncbi:hypothetical protein GCM10010260_30930 [Streptomyces filipinensis]|uniref:Uncharacterized protein n=1 Tax=Streptomyces filipinensis TaxID=66887 RepID=A0A918IB51_9ACTN|nr:hypothetical protein [Streptomyces filipinensis]GGU93690.1 hypothetical protein GCM10010260_30930 [Streptomyces filipinensis]
MTTISPPTLAHFEPTLPNAFWRHFTSTLAPAVEKEFGDHGVTEIEITLTLQDETIPYVGRVLEDVEIWFRWCMRLGELVGEYPISPPPVHLTYPSKMQFDVVNVQRGTLKITLKASPRGVYYGLKSLFVTLEILRMLAGGPVGHFIVHGPAHAPHDRVVGADQLPEPPPEVKRQELALGGVREGGSIEDGVEADLKVKLSNGEEISCKFTMVVRAVDNDSAFIADIGAACVQFPQ